MRNIRIILAAAMFTSLAVPAYAPAQEATGPDMEVDSIALAPGEGVVFGFGAGFSHQLLLVRHRGEEALATPLASGEVRAILYTDAGETWLEMENGTGETLYFDALADRNGNGGFGSVPSSAVPVGERIIAGRWAFPIASLVIGEFSYGPHGDHNH
jgi:hypothetical protein